MSEISQGYFLTASQENGKKVKKNWEYPSTMVQVPEGQERKISNNIMWEIYLMVFL